jgi:hypothetical protein
MAKGGPIPMDAVLLEFFRQLDELFTSGIPSFLRLRSGQFHSRHGSPYTRALVPLILSLSNKFAGDFT